MVNYTTGTGTLNPGHIRFRSLNDSVSDVWDISNPSPSGVITDFEIKRDGANFLFRMDSTNNYIEFEDTNVLLVDRIVDNDHVDIIVQNRSVTNPVSRIVLGLPSLTEDVILNNSGSDKLNIKFGDYTGSPSIFATFDKANSIFKIEGDNDSGYAQIILDNNSNSSTSYTQMQFTSSEASAKTIVLRHNSSNYRILNTSDSLDLFRVAFGTNKTYMNYIASGNANNLDYNTSTKELVYNSSVLSDKQDIEECTFDAEAIIQNITIKKYRRKNTVDDFPNLYEVGIIANDISDLLDEQQLTLDQKKTFLTYDESDILTGIRSGFIEKMQIKEIQRLQGLIDTQDIQIATLEDEVDTSGIEIADQTTDIDNLTTANTNQQTEIDNLITANTNQQTQINDLIANQNVLIDEAVLHGWNL